MVSWESTVPFGCNVTIHQTTNCLAESQGPKIRGADVFMTHTADIFCAPPQVHADLLGGIQRNDLTDVVEQRSDNQLISSSYVLL
jgi:hypothetical protein